MPASRLIAGMARSYMSFCIESADNQLLQVGQKPKSVPNLRLPDVPMPA